MGDITRNQVNAGSRIIIKKRAGGDTPLVTTIIAAADNAAKWAAVENWAGANDANVHDIGTAITNFQIPSTPRARLEQVTYSNPLGATTAKRGIRPLPDQERLELRNIDYTDAGMVVVNGLTDDDEIDVFFLENSGWLEATVKGLNGQSAATTKIKGGGYAYNFLVDSTVAVAGEASEIGGLDLPWYYQGATPRVIVPD